MFMVCLKKYRNFIYRFHIYFVGDKEVEIKSHITAIKHAHSYGTTLKIMNICNEILKLWKISLSTRKILQIYLYKII